MSWRPFFLFQLKIRFLILNLFILIECGLPGSFSIHNWPQLFSLRDKSSRVLDKISFIGVDKSNSEYRTVVYDIVNTFLTFMASVDILSIAIVKYVNSHETKFVSAGVIARLRSVNEFGSAGTISSQICV